VCFSDLSIKTWHQLRQVSYDDLGESSQIEPSRCSYEEIELTDAQTVFGIHHCLLGYHHSSRTFPCPIYMKRDRSCTEKMSTWKSTTAMVIAQETMVNAKDSFEHL